MKRLWCMIERYYPWLLLLLGVDCFCAIILWISDIQAFQTLSGLVVLTSLLLFSAILFVLNKRETTRRELFRDFLSDPTICNKERLLSAISREEGESIQLLASVLQAVSYTHLSQVPHASQHSHLPPVKKPLFHFVLTFP